MKKVLFVLSIVLSFLLADVKAQNLNNTFNMKVNALAVTSSNAPNFTVQLALTDNSLKYTGSDLQVGDYLYCYKNSGNIHRFQVTSIISKSASVAQVVVTDPTATITVFPTTPIAVARQTNIGLIQDVSNVSEQYKSIVENHNKTILSDTIRSKQNFLVSGTNIKTLNGATLLGSGDITVNSNSSTDLTNNYTPTTVEVQSSSGADVTINEANYSTNTAGVMSAQSAGQLTQTNNLIGVPYSSYPLSSFPANTFESDILKIPIQSNKVVDALDRLGLGIGKLDKTTSKENLSQETPFNLLRTTLKVDTSYNFVFIGDSRTAAGYTTDELTKMLSKKLGYSGNGYYNYGEAISIGGQAHTTDGDVLDLVGDALYSQSGRAVVLDANEKVEIQMKADSFGLTREAIFYYLAQPSSGEIELLVDNTLVQTINTASAITEVKTFSWNSTTKALNFKVRGKSSNTSQVTFLGMNLKSKKRGVAIHRIGNSGATTIQLSSINNYKYIKDVNPQLVFIRAGVNGLNALDVDLQKTSVSKIIDSIRTNVPTAGIIIVGESSNGLNPADYEDYINAKYYQLALDKKVGFVNLKDINYSWQSFQNHGYADLADNVHENSEGGKLYAQYIYDYIYNKRVVREYNAKNTFDTPTGISINNKESNGEMLDVTDEASTKVVASIGYKDASGNGSGWFNINKLGGVTDLTWFAKINNGTTNYISTAGLFQRQIKADNTGFYIRAPASSVTTGNNVTFLDQLQVQNNGLVTLSQGYNAATTATQPSATSYLGLDNSGTLTRRTFSQVKSDLGFNVGSLSSGRILYYDGSLINNTAWTFDNTTNSTRGTFRSNGSPASTSQLALVGTSESLVDLGTYSAGEYWSNISNESGYLYISQFAKRNTSSWTSTSGSFQPIQFGLRNDGFVLRNAASASVGSSVTWSDLFKISHSGRITLNSSYSNGTQTGTAAYDLKINTAGEIITTASSKIYKFVANANNVTDVDVTAASPSNGVLVQGSSALLSADLTNAHTNPNFEVWINGLKYNVKNSVVSTATAWAEGYVVFTGNSIAAYVSNNGTPNSKITINQIEIKK